MSDYKCNCGYVTRHPDTVRCEQCGNISSLVPAAGSTACDPFKEAKEIRAGKLDEKMPGFEVLTGWLQRVPMTWLPSLLVRTVSHCIKRKVFKDSDALMRTVQKAADQAGDETSMLRNNEAP
jgi:hypothetical protein